MRDWFAAFRDAVNSANGTGWAGWVVASENPLHDELKRGSTSRPGSHSLTRHQPLPPVFTIKLCGIRSLEEARLAVDAGADAIGLNFYAKSRRVVDRAVASEIARTLPPGTAAVGLFVNASAAEIQEVLASVRLDYLQLHGDESPELLREIAGLGLPIVRALRLDGEGLAPVDNYLAACKDLGSVPAGVLLDAAVVGQYGGTGQRIDWTVAARWRETPSRPPMILAGGLVPENVAQAIRAAQPHGVDTASGTESSPGVKDPEKMRSFVLNAREAFLQDPRR
jgi:phosphoribosylanthranilate isomerase